MIDTDYRQQSEETKPPTADRPSAIVAVIVAYFPDDALFQQIPTLAAQVEQVLIVDNTPTDGRDSAFAIHCAAVSNLYYRANGRNLGIATALNQALHFACEGGFRWMVMLDQDTEWYPNMIEVLIHAAEFSTEAHPIIGSNYYDPRLQCTAAILDGDSEILPRKTVITSGCVVSPDFANYIGGFRDDYFIDQVDHEFCLRARQHGATVAITRRPIMNHTVGRNLGLRIPFTKKRLPGHSPLRKYYIARNSIVTILDFWSVEPIWCLKRLAKLTAGILFIIAGERGTYLKLRASIAGIKDGICRNMGPCTRRWIIDSDAPQAVSEEAPLKTG